MLGWAIAGIAICIAALEALALAALSPLKTTEAYAILVDRQTGHVEVARPVAPGALSQNEAVTKAYLIQYVLARETFDAADLKDNYRKVQLLSANPARSDYLSWMRADNPEGPLNRNLPTTRVFVTIKSVSLTDAGSALVRFDLQKREAGENAARTTAWIATIQFGYSDAAMSDMDRAINPLGFQISTYRRDPDGNGASFLEGAGP